MRHTQHHQPPTSASTTVVIMDHENELSIVDQEDDEPKTPPHRVKRPMQPNNILSNALSVVAQQQQQQQEVPTSTFLILGRRLKSKPSDPTSKSLYAFARAYCTAHCNNNNMNQKDQLSQYRNNNSDQQQQQQQQQSITINNKNTHSEGLYHLVSQTLKYKDGTDMFQQMNINRRKIPKKKTLLADLKRWGKIRKQAYIQFHSDRNQQIAYRIHQEEQERYLIELNHSTSHHHQLLMNTSNSSINDSQHNAVVDLLCDESTDQ
jgi:hypothetical protein